MLVIKSDVENIAIPDNSCIALGTFDGIHLGHQALIKECVSSAKERGIKSVVLTFDAPPMSVLAPRVFSGIILDNSIKIEMIEKMGVDYLIFIHFTKEFSINEPEKFIGFLKKKLNAKMLICGYNYSFGKYGRGNTNMLEAFKDSLEYELKVFEPVMCGKDVVSSTIVRKKLMEGRIAEASRLLGYIFFIEGVVQHGRKVGSKLGFPTANINVNKNLVIKNGVYAARTLIGNKAYNSITNIGYAPTFDDRSRTAEVFVMNFCGSLYDIKIKVELLEYIRPEEKFSSQTQLEKQMNKDMETAREFFSET